MKNLKRIDEAVGSLAERRAVNESTAKNVLKDAINALTKTFAGKKLDKAYVKDYIASMERMARKSPREFVKDYMNFSNDDWIEDVEYNMANENVNEGLLLQTVRKSIGKIQTALKKKWKKTGGYENFGQDEIRDLKSDGRWYNPYGDAEQRKAAKLIDALDQWAMNYTGESVEFIDENKFDIALNKMDEWLPEDPEAMERYMEILNQEGPKDMEKFFIEFGNEDRLQSYGLKSRDMKKLAKMAFESEEVNEGFRRSREPFTFTAKEVQDAADLIAKAITKMDKVKAAVHDMEYHEGEGASFEISMDGEKYEGGSYDVRPTGEVVNVAIGNSFPNAIYAKIGDNNINQIMKNIKKFESFEVNEAAPRMKKSKEVEELEKLRTLVINSKKGGAGNRYGKEFDKEKNKAIVALDNMISYAKIGV